MTTKMLFLTFGLIAGHTAAAPATEQDSTSQVHEQVEALDHNEVSGEHGRELFPLYTVGKKCARRGCSIYDQMSSVQMSAAGKQDNSAVKVLEMLALNDDLDTVVRSDSMCTRRNAMARAAGLAAGLALSTVSAPGFAAQTSTVKMGSDSGQLVFVPAEIKICKGDSVTWVMNKAGPHNVVFDEEGIPSGVSAESISMEEQIGDEGETFTRKFETPGTYAYYCEPHRSTGMQATLVVEG